MTLQKVGVTLSNADSSNKFGLGAEHIDDKGGVFVYGQASGAVTQYQIASMPEDFDCAALTTTISGDKPSTVGIAMATLADNEFGWFAVGPFGTDSGVSVSALASCAADVKVYTTATAGSIDDTATDLIEGLALSTANGGSTANVACYATQRLVVNSQS